MSDPPDSGLDSALKEAHFGKSSNRERAFDLGPRGCIGFIRYRGTEGPTRRRGPPCRGPSVCSGGCLAHWVLLPPSWTAFYWLDKIKKKNNYSAIVW